MRAQYSLKILTTIEELNLRGNLGGDIFCAGGDAI